MIAPKDTFLAVRAKKAEKSDGDTGIVLPDQAQAAESVVLAVSAAPGSTIDVGNVVVINESMATPIHVRGKFVCYSVHKEAVVAKMSNTEVLKLGMEFEELPDWVA